MSLRRTVTTICAACFTVVMCFCGPLAAAKQPPHGNNSLSFALIGDQPYNDFFEPATASLIQHLGLDPNIQWILHLGDIKGGNEPCTNELLQRRMDQLRQSEKPLVLVPGDNEWTDCHRISNGNFNSQERLTYLRQLAFARPHSMGKKGFAVRQQTSHPYPEHLMWTQGSTLFLSLNIPGSNNDLLNPKTRQTSKQEVQALLAARDEAIDAWLNEAEALFDDERTRPTETVIAIQGNPIDGSGGNTADPAQNGYAHFMKRLVRFIDSTKRPVLLAHGDTHRFKWDKPSLQQFGGSASTDTLFYRVEGWGHPFVNVWVQVEIMPGHSEPFEARSMSLPSTQPNN